MGKNFECPDCGESVRSFAGHVCRSGKSSGGKPEEGLKEVTLPSTAPHSSLSGKRTSAGTGSAGVFGSIPNASTNSAVNRPTSSKGGVEGHATRLGGYPQSGAVPTNTPKAGIKPGPLEANSAPDHGAPHNSGERLPKGDPADSGADLIKRGRPKLDEPRVTAKQLAAAAGMSERSWYRRRAKK
jgi:hypothetical protein